MTRRQSNTCNFYVGDLREKAKRSSLFVLLKREDRVWGPQR